MARKFRCELADFNSYFFGIEIVFKRFLFTCFWMSIGFVFISALIVVLLIRIFLT